MFELALTRGDRPLYEQIADKVAALVQLGTLQPGTRLPGSRALARRWGVSRHTVLAALEELCARGLLVPREGSGHFVQGSPRVKSASRPMYDLSSDAPRGALSPCEALAAGAEVLFARALQDSPLQGLPEARRALAAHAAGRGITCGPDDVWLNGGGRQGLGALLYALRRQGVKRLWCPALAWEALPEACRADDMALRRYDSLPDQLGPADALYVNSTFANPTGETLSDSLRRAWAAESERRGFWIVEDDAYGDLRWRGEAKPALRAWNADRVAYLASLSQTFNPGLRIGYALVPRGLREGFEMATARRFGPLSSLLQAWVVGFCGGRAEERALKTLRAEGARRMAALCTALGIVEGEAPEGGPFLWLPLPCSGRSFADRALAAGVRVSPGEAFGEGTVKGVRLSIAGHDVPALVRAGRLLKKLIEA